MDSNNIQFIYQRLALLRSLIPQCKAQSAAAENKRLADTIITLEIKRFETIHALENRLRRLRALIPLYKARSPTYEHVLAKQIIDLDLQLIAPRTKQFSTHPLAQHPLATHPRAPFPLAPYPLAPHQSEAQPVQLDDMVGFLSERPRQVPNSYCQPGQPIGAQVNNFRQIKY